MNTDNLKKGYVIFSRSLLEHSFWKENREFSRAEAWIDIIFSVNYSNKTVLLGNTLFECLRGQCLYSLDTWRSRWGWKSKHKVRNFLMLLVNQEMITYESSPSTVIVTVTNYDHYQHQIAENIHDEQVNFAKSQTQLSENNLQTGLSNSAHLMPAETASYKRDGNATGTRPERDRNATGTRRERDGNQVIKVIKVIKETKENVCESHTHSSEIIELQIQQLRKDYIANADAYKDLDNSLQMLAARCEKLNEGAIKNSLSIDEWLLERNDVVKKYNACNAALNEKNQACSEIELQGRIKNKELEALKSRGQYDIFSESVFSDKVFFVHSLQNSLKGLGIIMRKDEIEEYYDRAKTYSASKLMKSANWIEEVAGWVRKDKARLKKAS